MHDWPTARTFAHGLLLRPELLAAGGDNRSIARAVQQGQLHRVRPGAFVPAEVWQALTVEQRHAVRARAVLLHARCEAVLSHGSAMVELEQPIWGIGLDQVHLTRLDDRAGRRHVDVAQHQGRISADDVTTSRGLRVTSGTRTALDLCRVLPTEPAVVAVSGLLHSGLTTPEQLAARHHELCRRSDSLGTAVVLGLADGRVESVAEGRFLYLCWKQHLPRPVPQYEVWHEGRMIARLDFAWPDKKAWLEVDGETKYRVLRRPGESVEDAVLREKRREDLVRAVLDWKCVRMGWRDYRRPAVVAAEVLSKFDD